LIHFYKRKMAFTLNTSILRTPTGLLKILEMILVFIVLMLARFSGPTGSFKYFGGTDATFLGLGTVVGYAIIVPAVLFTYLMGSNLSILELFINFVGGVLFIAIGSVAIQTYTGYRAQSDHAGVAMGVLSIMTGIVFLIDFLFAIKNTKFTVVQTRVVA